MSVYNDRQEQKRRNTSYREAAARVRGVSVDPFANVQQLSDGAYVEAQVWVPLSEIEMLCPKHGIPIVPDSLCEQCVAENPHKFAIWNGDFKVRVTNDHEDDGA